MWRRAGRQAGVDTRIIEVICSNQTEHRSRLSNRVRNIDGFPEPTWDGVMVRRREWEQWREDRIVLDSVEPFPDNVDRAVAYVRD